MKSRQRMKFNNLKILNTQHTEICTHTQKKKLTLVNEYIKTLKYRTAQETIQK